MNDRKAKLRLTGTKMVIGLAILIITLLGAVTAIYSEVYSTAKAIPTPGAITVSDLYNAVGNYCENYGYLSHWEWKPEEDPDPTDKVIPAVCYLDLTDLEIKVNLETLEVTPRK